MHHRIRGVCDDWLRLPPVKVSARAPATARSAYQLMTLCPALHSAVTCSTVEATMEPPPRPTVAVSACNAHIAPDLQLRPVQYVCTFCRHVILLVVTIPAAAEQHVTLHLRAWCCCWCCMGGRGSGSGSGSSGRYPPGGNIKCHLPPVLPAAAAAPVRCNISSSRMHPCLPAATCLLSWACTA